ncbi:MAG: S-layer homology domain-containing protein [Clostridia bacterium]|nr:S-layer homology domain-containing protein [Clostridia bacterium]
MEAGIFTGYGDGTFRPNDYMTREEVAATVMRALKAAGVAI